MANCCWIFCFLVFSSLVGVHEANPAGESDSLYRACFAQCEKTGCVGARCFTCCNSAWDGSWYKHIKHLYLWWKHWDCQSNCRYHCMLYRERERSELGLKPVKYHGKWPSRQEPFSVAFSALNLLMHFHGWRSFSNLLYYSLPLKPDKTPFYEYASLFNIYGILSINTWFWSAIFHFRNVGLTEKLYYSSVVALLGYSIILAIIRSFSLRNDAARVMVAAPMVAFAATHILYLCNYKMDYGWNMKVCIGMGVGQVVTWLIWGGVTRHPCRWKLWMVVAGGGVGMLLKIWDIRGYGGLVDGHALWQASNIPLTYMWWNFIKDDAEFRTVVYYGTISLCPLLQLHIFVDNTSYLVFSSANLSVFSISLDNINHFIRDGNFHALAFAYPTLLQAKMSLSFQDIYTFCFNTYHILILWRSSFHQHQSTHVQFIFQDEIEQLLNIQSKINKNE